MVIYLATHNRISPHPSSLELRTVINCEIGQTSVNSTHELKLFEIRFSHPQLTIGTPQTRQLQIYRNNLKSYLYRSLPNKISYFYMYSRRINITLARIRMQCNELLYHLYQNHIADSPNCPCGVIETPEHYFFDCPLHHILLL